MSEPYTHHVTLRGYDFHYLLTGEKSFMVMTDTQPALRYGDVLVMTCPGYAQTLTRWVAFIENGIGYLPDTVGVEVRP